MYHGDITGDALDEAVEEQPPVVEESDAAAALMELINPGEEPSQAPEQDQPEEVNAGDFLTYYGLARNPFSDSVNPEFFYKTEQHDETYIKMMLAIEHHISLGLVTGGSGTGKTLVSQMLLHNLESDKYQPVVVLVTPGMSKTALLREILNELGLPPLEGLFVRTQELVKQLSDHVIELYHEDKRLVILIDECHFLSSESLHIIRTISNIELPDRKLVTCLLFAEKRFLNRLKHPSYESLRNRMYMHGQLLPISEKDCAEYVKYRLMVAGRMDDLFNPGALGAIHRHSGGICRRINKLGMLVLIEGFLRRKTVIDEQVVEKCAQDL